MAGLMESGRKIAIFGGTFDPIHLGHLLIAQQAYNSFSLSEVIFMPAGIPPHKSNLQITPPEFRLEMVKRAISDNPVFSYSDYELNKSGHSYTAETLRHYQELAIADKIYFIIGADSLLEIFTWHEPEYLLNNGFFIVARRPGYNLKGVLQRKEYWPYRDHIFIMDCIEIDISSTEIRKMVREGKSVKYQTRDEVIKYISEKGLYRGD